MEEKNIHTNPFLQQYDTPHETVPFCDITIADYEEAMIEGMRREDEQIERIIKDEYSFVNICELNAMNNQSVTILFKTMSVKMTGQTIDEAGLDITSESIVQITPVHFKCLCLKCQ